MAGISKFKANKADVVVKWEGDLAIAAQQKAGKRGMQDAVEHLLEESNKIVPFDESDLMKSGDVDVKVNAKTLVGYVYYDTPYAVRMHEHPEYNFQNGREGKYLQKTLVNQKSAVMQFMKDAYKKAFK